MSRPPWRRTRHRVQPAKPKVGVRATKTNEIWHIDTTVLRLLDGSRVYLHAVIDNFSRRILAWRVLARFHPVITAQLLLDGSNSMIESWWRVLKHQWLYLNQLDSVRTIQKLVAFYVEQHNSRLPPSAFQGQTPDERYFGTGGHIPKKLNAARLAARQIQLEANRAMSCERCEPLVSIGG